MEGVPLALIRSRWHRSGCMGRSSPTDHPPGWTCDIVLSKLARYLVGDLRRGELLAIAEHIEVCILCAQRVPLESSDLP
jgi:hypothetical protein